ncbi:MAG: hypothetical protein ACR2IP_12340 [Solirubrobacteraceae bacterium]
MIVDSTGHLFITGSHAGIKSGTAVFKVALTAPGGPSGTGTATLSPTFLDNASATDGKGGGTVKLSLGDVDSSAIVPQSSPRFGGSFVIDDQTALQLVFAGNIDSGTGLTALKTPFGLDDIRWATSDGGMLYVVDNGGTKPGASAVYKVTGPFKTGTVLASNDSVSSEIVKVNLTTGGLTPFVRGLTTTKGLVYVNASGSVTQLPVAGSAAAPAAPASKPAAIHKPSSSAGGSNTATIVIVIVVVLLLLGGGGYTMMRRRPSPAA